MEQDKKDLITSMQRFLISSLQMEVVRLHNELRANVRTIPSFPDYCISENGVVRNKRNGNVIVPTLNKNGYFQVGLRNSGIPKKQYIHTLVAEAFIGVRPSGMQVSHLDGDSTNNKASNLIYESCIENISRKRQHGTILEGESNPCSKLNRIQAQEIRKRFVRKSKRVSNTKELAIEYGVAVRTISQVVNGKSWKQLDATA